MSDPVHERPVGTPLTDETWAGLAPSVLVSVARYDACRLEIERSGLAPGIREAVAEPVYSDWQLPGQYPISAYVNDLDGHARLHGAMGTLTREARSELSVLLAALDARFVSASVPDEEGELRPWLKPSPGDEPHGFRLRRPRRHPW
ncbi:hypothetical protein [Streptomyces atroolivaceus]|uniref:hypothetical protein n=1 Tax=Streptomyces atroolivaceus TaxID=66869 RepID=UPI0037B5B070